MSHVPCDRGRSGENGLRHRKRLSEEGHDVTLVDKLDENLQEAAAHLDIVTLEGTVPARPCWNKRASSRPRCSSP